MSAKIESSIRRIQLEAENEDETVIVTFTQTLLAEQTPEAPIVEEPTQRSASTRSSRSDPAYHMSTTPEAFQEEERSEKRKDRSEKGEEEVKKSEETMKSHKKSMKKEEERRSVETKQFRKMSNEELESSETKLEDKSDQTYLSDQSSAMASNEASPSLATKSKSEKSGLDSELKGSKTSVSSISLTESEGHNDFSKKQKFQLKKSKNLNFLLALKRELPSEPMARINEMLKFLKTNHPDVKVSLADFETKYDDDKFDLVIVCGGDGTFLRAVSLFTNQVPPIIGFKAGNLNFLLHYDLNVDFQTVFDDILNGDVITTTLYRLLCRWSSNGTYSTTNQAIAVNDICLHRGQDPLAIIIEVTLNDHEVLTINGDGIIVSSPTGSSAYSMAAGGAIIHEQVQCFQVGD